MTTSISSGSITTFRSSTAQPGWTKITTYTDYALRIVNGNAGTGGSVNFSTVFATVPVSGTASMSVTASDVTLSLAQMASHTHSGGSALSGTLHPSPTATWGGPATAPTVTGYASQLNTPGATSGTTGTAGAHTHTGSAIPLTFVGNPISFAVQYVDMILAQRN